MAWSRPFDDPIPLPDGRVLRTLADAGYYIVALPEAEQQRTEWQMAGEMLQKATDESRAGHVRADRARRCRRCFSMSNADAEATAQASKEIHDRAPEMAA